MHALGRRREPGRAGALLSAFIATSRCVAAPAPGARGCSSCAAPALAPCPHPFSPTHPPHHPPTTHPPPTPIVAFVLALVVVGVSTTNSGRASATFALSPDAEAGGGANSTTGTDPDDETVLPYRPDFFHLVFLLASAYISMVLVGWGVGAESQGEFAYDQGWGSTWAKVAASWACAALYTWSLVAHHALGSCRQF